MVITHQQRHLNQKPNRNEPDQGPLEHEIVMKMGHEALEWFLLARHGSIPTVENTDENGMRICRDMAGME